MSLLDNMLILMIVIRLVIGVSLLKKSKKSGMKNLYWLSAVFLINGLNGVFFMDAYMNPTVQWFGAGVTLLCHLVFTVQTFFQNKSSPFKTFFAISVGLSMISVIIAVLVQFGNFIDLSSTIPSAVYAVNVAITWGWYYIVTKTAYKEVENSKFVEDWVKKRYKLTMLYSLMIIIASILIPLYAENQNTSLMLITFLLIDGSLIVQFMAWVMPKSLKKFFNRNFLTGENIQDDNLSEEEIMMQFAGGE